MTISNFANLSRNAKEEKARRRALEKEKSIAIVLYMK